MQDKVISQSQANNNLIILATVQERIKNNLLNHYLLCFQPMNLQAKDE